MDVRVGVGPVFVWEAVTAARRWHVYALRSLFVLLLLAAIALMWYFEGSNASTTSRALAKLGEAFFYAIATVQLTLILLAAPAATAGAICLDRARGTLAHMMMTDLSSAEIVLGKLAARLVPILSLILCTTPVVALAMLLGGVDPAAMLGVFLVSTGAALVGSSLALLLSVWGRKPHEVLMLTYMILLGWILIDPLWELFRDISSQLFQNGPPEWLAYADPYWLAFAPYSKPGALGLVEQFLFLLGCAVIAGGLAALATARLRRIALQREPKAGPPGRWRRFWARLPKLPRLPGPPLDFNPVLWRSWHYGQPTGWTRLVWGGYWLISFGMMALFGVDWLLGANFEEEWPMIINGLMVLIGLLLVGVKAPTALAEERVRGSLDVLLTTPLSTASIVWGKWWGAFRPLFPLAVVPALVTLLALPWPRNLIGALQVYAFLLAVGAAQTSLGLALATWTPRLGRAIGISVTAYILVTVGLYCMVGVIPNEEMQISLALGSPFLGAAILPAFGMGADTSPSNERQWLIAQLAIHGWTLIYFAWAAALGLATWLMFDHCLGRMREQSRPRLEAQARAIRRPWLGRSTAQVKARSDRSASACK